MKKLISLLLAAMMVLSLGAVGAAADEAKEVVIATNSLGNGWPTNLEDDYVYQKILKDTGIAMKFVLVDDYYTAITTRLYEGEFDMFLGNREHMRTWSREGLLLDLTPYMENELKPFFDWLGATQLASYYHDGKMSSLPLLFDGSKKQHGVSYRQDWLENLNLELPTTIQELYDVCYAFTYNDPDGNGKNDTYGMTAGKGDYLFNAILGSFDTILGNNIIVRDGKVTNTILQPGMLAGLEWCKKFVDAKIVDTDAVTRKGDDMFIAGLAGFIHCSWPGIWKADPQAQIVSINPNAKCGYFTSFKSEVGAPEVMSFEDYNASSYSYAISADVSEEKLATIFELVNYLISDEGYNLILYGLEDVHWTRDENGRIHMTDRALEANYISTYQIFSRKEKEYLGVKFPEAEEVFNKALSAGRVIIYNSLVVEDEEMYLSDMESYVKNEQLKFIFGERPLTEEEYAKFVQELNDVYGFDKYMQDASEQLAAHGVV